MLKSVGGNALDVTGLDQLAQAVSTLSAALDACKGNVVYLTGQLGCGKTTLAQHWLRRLGVEGAITSPTYTIVNEYDGYSGHYIHADLYRIADPEELLYLDVREWREQASLILIEWPERGEGYIPAPDMHCHLSLAGERRTLMWQTVAGAAQIQDLYP